MHTTLDLWTEGGWTIRLFQCELLMTPRHGRKSFPQPRLGDKHGRLSIPFILYIVFRWSAGCFWRPLCRICHRLTQSCAGSFFCAACLVSFRRLVTAMAADLANELAALRQENMRLKLLQERKTEEDGGEALSIRDIFEGTGLVDLRHDALPEDSWLYVSTQRPATSAERRVSIEVWNLSSDQQSHKLAWWTSTEGL